MKGYIILLGLIFIISSLFGQTTKECNQILKKKISINDMQQGNIDQFIADFQTMVLCEFDSIDLQIFMGPQGNMPLMAGALLAIGKNRDKKEEKITFNDIKEIFKEYKQQDEYFQVRQIVEAKNQIIKHIAKISDWNTDKELLMKMGFTKSHLEDIYAIVKENESVSYSDIFLIYSDTLLARKEKLEVEKESNYSKLEIETTELNELITGLYAYEDYKIGLAKSKELNKPVLLYFNGYGCVNARKIEDKILRIPDIKNYITDNLILINLIVDNRTKLDESYVYFSETLNRTVRIIGQINLELEIKEFNSDRQPLFILLDLNGNEISRIGYTDNIEEFDSFLKTIEK